MLIIVIHFVDFDFQDGSPMASNRTSYSFPLRLNLYFIDPTPIILIRSISVMVP